MIEFDNVDCVCALMLFGDDTYSNSPTIHYDSEESGGPLTVLFDTCDDKRKGIINVAGDEAPECPSYVIVSIFDLV